MDISCFDPPEIPGDFLISPRQDSKWDIGKKAVETLVSTSLPDQPLETRLADKPSSLPDRLQDQLNVHPVNLDECDYQGPVCLKKTGDYVSKKRYAALVGPILYFLKSKQVDGVNVGTHCLVLVYFGKGHI